MDSALLPSFSSFSSRSRREGCRQAHHIRFCTVRALPNLLGRLGTVALPVRPAVHLICLKHRRYSYLWLKELEQPLGVLAVLFHDGIYCTGHTHKSCLQKMF